ncbi:hypothetical protein QC3_0875 [Clostridioides difficile CD22]|nr:hypothetical protein QC3_0875 [Clostridioides difficile CD22]
MLNNIMMEYHKLDKHLEKYTIYSEDVEQGIMNLVFLLP